MKQLLFLSIYTILLTSCGINYRKINHVREPEKRSPKENENNSYILKCDTAVINDSRFIACQNSELVIYILNNRNDTIFKNTNSTNEFEFTDFDEDGYPDILLSYISIYSAYELGLFDECANNFKNVEDFNNYPNATRIKNTKYYYSYTHTGCADSNWRSDLFYIENYKAYGIGSIEGIGCEDEDKNGIFIYKANGEEQELIKSIPREAGYYEEKWNFIENYWNNNYILFEK